MTKHFVRLTLDEITTLSLVVEILLKDEKYISQLKDVPISERFQKDLTSANQELDRKIQELGNGPDRK